jgi:hypothetical protein
VKWSIFINWPLSHPRDNSTSLGDGTRMLPNPIFCRSIRFGHGIEAAYTTLLHVHRDS